MIKRQVKFEIGRICIGINSEREEIIKDIELCYKDFLSDKKPDILIELKYRNFSIPDTKSSIYQTDTWKLVMQGNHGFIYFPMGDTPSLAMFNHRFDVIKFYTLDSLVIAMMYLFPQILFSLMIPKSEWLMLHACGVLDNERGYLFIGSSGEGKTTIAKLAVKQGFTVLNDEKIIIHKENNFFRIYGCPWYGEIKGCSSNPSCRISKIFFLKRAPSNKIAPIDKKDSVQRLLKNNFYIPINSDIIKSRFNICSDIAENMENYELNFKNDDLLWRFLNGFFEQDTKKKQKNCMAYH